MINVDVILKMSWLRKVNFQMNWATDKWRVRKNSSKSSNSRRVAIDKQGSEDLKNESNDFYIAQMSWSKLQFILSESNAFAFATLLSLESKRKRLLVVIEKIDENSSRISNEISSQYVAFQDIFFEVETHKLSEHDSHDHVIETLSNRESFFDLIYNLSATKLKILKNYIDEYMKKNFITEFVSSARVFILFVKKTNDKLRLCVNYRNLNEIIIKNRYSLSLINENLNKLFEARIFIKLNVKDVFHRIRIREEDEWKTTFRCRFDHYQYWIMFFELANSSITFQVYINKTMHSYLDLFVLMYINDLLMFFSFIEEHIEHVKLMLQRLRQFNLYFKLSKCSFHVFHVNFLDFRMSFEDIAMQTSRVIVVKNWSKSKSHRDVQVFIKFANFYKRFVHAFFKASAELISLLKESEKEKFRIKFVMILETKEFMKQIKRIFMSASMLRHYEFDDESMMKTNVFDFVITRIFSQLAKIDDQWRSIAFYFRKMIFVERNYEINDQKMLVIVKICKKWRYYIKDVKYFVRMIIDHVNLKNFFINKTLSRKKVRWWERLAELDLKIKYRFDKNNFADDSFCRRDYENETTKEDKNNENLNLRKWVLIESKNTLKNKNEKRKKKNTYFFQSTNHRFTTLSNADSNSSETFETIDETSRSNCFTRNNFEKDAEISIVKNAQNFLKKEKIVATVKRTLKRKKSFKSSSRDIEKISKTLRLENVANSENLASRDWIKNVSSKKATFNASFLKLRIVLLILQQFDSLAQRIRFFVEKASMKHDKESESVKRLDSDKSDDVVSNCSRKNVDLDSSFKWNIENDLLRWKDKWYILSKFLKREFLKQNHDDSYVDHFEHERTFDLLKRKYFWNNMSKDVKEYVDICSTCHRIKFVRHKSHDMLQSLSILEKSRQNWTMNFIIDLSFSKHKKVVYDSMLMIIDRYIKFNLYISSKKTWNAEDLTNALIDEIFIKFERLVFIVTDRDSFFIFKFWSSLCYHLWVRLRYNIVYHSQIDEQIERQNQTLELYLKSYVNYQQNDWVRWFNIIEYVYNNSLNSVLKQTFFQMMFDSEIKFENVIQKDLKIDVFAARDRVVHVSKMRRTCETRWKQTLERAERNYNKKRVQIEFKINDKIFLNARNIISIRSFKKLNYKYYDSYTINESINKISYKLNLSSIMKDIHDVFHVFFLKFANEKNDETSSFIWIEDEKQWKIEEIVDRRIKNNKTSYLIKWLEYSHSNNEWVKEEDMSNVKKIIEKFLSKSSTKNDRCVSKRRRWDENFSMHSFQTFFHEIFYHWF
jgi:hypothetical protein